MHERRVEFRLAVVGVQTVQLLLDVGQLRVAQGAHARVEQQHLGQPLETVQEFLDRFKGLTEVLLFHPRMGALCYTQLTDVEQELNGLYTYDRKPKFDPAFMHAVLTQKAAIEE